MPQFVNSDLDKAVEILRRGGLVAYPTDTLYGLGANALSEDAVEKVYEAKGRPLNKPMPVLLSSFGDLTRVAQHASDVARLLALSFWPGALTMVLESRPGVSDLITAGTGTIAVRVPNHPVPRELVRKLGAPITGTSANGSGGANPTTPEIVRAQIGDTIDIVIDGGPCPGDMPSTVVDVTRERAVLLREGVVSREEIEQTCGLPIMLAQ